MPKETRAAEHAHAARQAGRVAPPVAVELVRYAGRWLEPARVGQPGPPLARALIEARVEMEKGSGGREPGRPTIRLPAGEVSQRHALLAEPPRIGRSHPRLSFSTLLQMCMKLRHSGSHESMGCPRWIARRMI